MADPDDPGPDDAGPDETHPGPATYDDLVAEIHEGWDSLTPAHRRLAEQVLADPEGLAFMTVSDLAAVVDVNESTVVRFAHALGLRGYPGLTRLCRDKLREEAQLLHRFANVESLLRDSVDPLEAAIGHEQANLTRTLARIDREAWDAVVDLLAAAPRVYVLGMRKCYSVGFLFGYLLRMVRDGVTTLSSGTGSLVEELRPLAADDCFVGISIHRYSRETVRAFRWARAQGATTVALTDNEASPLAAEADHTFLVDTTGVAVLRSMTAFVALVQALANAVAAKRGLQTREVLTVEEDLLDHFEVYE